MQFSITRTVGNNDRGKYYVVRDYESTTTDDVIFRTVYVSKDEYENWKSHMMSVVGTSHVIESETESQIVFVPLHGKGA